MQQTKTKEGPTKRRAREAGERVAELRAEAMTIPLEKWAPPPVIRRRRAKVVRSAS